jgi:hypothetical protein
MFGKICNDDNTVKGIWRFSGEDGVFIARRPQVNGDEDPSIIFRLMTTAGWTQEFVFADSLGAFFDATITNAELDRFSTELFPRHGELLYTLKERSFGTYDNK